MEPKSMPKLINIHATSGIKQENEHYEGSCFSAVTKQVIVMQGASFLKVSHDECPMGKCVSNISEMLPTSILKLINNQCHTRTSDVQTMEKGINIVPQKGTRIHQLKEKRQTRKMPWEHLGPKAKPKGTLQRNQSKQGQHYNRGCIASFNAPSN